VCAEQVKALGSIQSERVKALLRAIDRLQSEVATLRAANKEHHRSAHVRALQRRLKEQDVVVFLLKKQLASYSSMDMAQIDDMIIAKTVGTVPRVRPKASRPVLAVVVDALDGRVRRPERSSHKRSVRC
jgi:hypothetical protein